MSIFFWRLFLHPKLVLICILNTVKIYRNITNDIMFKIYIILGERKKLSQHKLCSINVCCLWKMYVVVLNNKVHYVRQNTLLVLKICFDIEMYVDILNNKVHFNDKTHYLYWKCVLSYKICVIIINDNTHNVYIFEKCTVILIEKCILS